MWHDNVLGTIGNTPLVKLNRVVGDLPCTVLAKVEFFNPGGSVKDRIAMGMIEDAEQKGLLKPGGTIVEGTSGNTGAGLAIAGIVKGYRCIFTTTDKQSPEKMDVLRALGAEVVVCPTNVEPDDPRSYYSVAARLAQEIPGAYYPNQYDHPANAEAHYQTTGPEIWRDTAGQVTHYVAGAGTGGSISGTARFLKEQSDAVRVIGVDPEGSVYYKYFHEGVFDANEIHPYLTEGVGEDILAGNMDFEIVDDYVQVSDKAAMLMTRRLSEEEGLFIGQSCGMAVAGALDWLRAHRDELKESDVVVIMLPDSGFRYLGKTYNDEWMRRQGFWAPERPLTADAVLKSRSAQNGDGAGLLTARADEPLAEAAARMVTRGVSQVPVLDGEGELVGSLSEDALLRRLVEEPEARTLPVKEAMQPALPVVPADLPLDKLSARLGEGGAVLVQNGDGYAILTRADLIAALAGDGS
jgi:cystathionine beta-synthase